VRWLRHWLARRRFRAVFCDTPGPDGRRCVIHAHHEDAPYDGNEWHSDGDGYFWVADPAYWHRRRWQPEPDK